VAKTPIADIVAAIEKTNALSKVVEQHELLLERLVDRVTGMEARLQALESGSAKLTADG
jgi:hypothetical protein